MAPVLKIQCPKCNGRLKITPKEEASKVRCPGCEASIKVPPLPKLEKDTEAEDYDKWAEESADVNDYEDDSEWDSAESGSEWDDTGDEYGDGENEYEERRRKRAVKKKRKPAKKPEPKPPINLKLLSGVGLTVGLAFTGLMIFLFSGGDDAPPEGDGPEAPVAQGNGTDTGEASTESVTQTAGPETIAEVARNYVREQASLISEVKRSTWGNLAGELRRNWDIPADPSPQRDFAAIQALSEKNAGITFGYADSANKWCSLPRPAIGENSVLLNLETMSARQLQGQTESMSSAAEVGYVSSGGMSNDGELIGRELRVNRSRLDAREHWVTIHKYDNTIVKVIPGAKKMHFLAGSRILLASDAIADSKDVSRKDGHRQARDRHLLSRTVWFQNVETDEKSELIAIRNGGHWLLSPTRKYLVIVEPDATTASGLDNPMAPAFNGMPASTELSVYDTATGEKIAEAAYKNLTVGFYGGFSSDGTRLALHAGQNVAVLDMTTGQVQKTGTLIDVEDHTVFSVKSPQWVAEDRFLLLDWNRLIDVETGIAFGSVTAPGVRTSQKAAAKDWLGGRYVRYSYNGAYWPFPIEQLKSAAEAISDPNANLLAERKVTLKVSGTEQLPALEQDMIRECLAEMLASRCRLKVTNEGDHLPVVEVRYSESKKEGPFSMERWHQDATRQVVDTDRNSWVRDQYVLNVTLEFRGVTADGRELATDKCDGVGVPSGMNFSIPGVIQFRNAALVKAAEELSLDLPALVSNSPDGLTIPRDWPLEIVKAEPTDYAALSIEKVEVNNGWLAEDHGLPVRLATMHLAKDQLNGLSKWTVSRFDFVSQNDTPALLMHTRQAE